MLKSTRNTLSYIAAIAIFSFFALAHTFDPDTETQQTFYIDSQLGNDNYEGTSQQKPWKSFIPLRGHKLKSGTTILLANGSVFSKTLILKNIIAEESKPILISNYKKSDTTKANKPFINVVNKAEAIRIENCSNIKITNLKVSAQKEATTKEKETYKMRCGVLIKITKPGHYSGITLNHLDVENVFMNNPRFVRPPYEVKTANGKQEYGWGIRVINQQKKAVLEKVTIQHTQVQNVAHTGIKFTAFKPINGQYGLRKIKIHHNELQRTGGPGIQMSGVQDAHVFKNKVNQSGSNDDSRKWGRGSGLWTWSSDNVLIEYNRFTNAKGPGDSAGAHIDFNCKNIILQYNFSANNAGGFCEILGNNYNCAYRYNISVNDGFRVKGENHAFQEGKLFWLSGYVGPKKRTGPFNSYFYNNTMYVAKPIVSKIAIDKEANGVLIANNIFYLENKSELVKGDQYNPEKQSNKTVQNVVFTNNLFLHESAWPENLLKQQISFFGNPKFTNNGGTEIVDYTPKNISLTQNKGIHITKIPNDSIGLVGGMRLEKDILGNYIDGLPDLGAIEIKN